MNLSETMRKKHAMNLGQRKFIYYRSPKKNNLIKSFIKNNKHNSLHGNNTIQNIKDYYFNKKIKGYSSLINPLNNTYINRQKTIKIKNIN